MDSLWISGGPEDHLVISRSDKRLVQMLAAPPPGGIGFPENPFQGFVRV